MRERLIKSQAGGNAMEFDHKSKDMIDSNYLKLFEIKKLINILTQ
jgi:hypothetical protein